MSTHEMTSSNGNQTPRRSRWKSWAAAIAAVLIGMSILLSRSDAKGFPVTGMVIDGETNKPIPHVWVTQEWRSKTTWGIPFMVDGNSTRSMCDAYQLTQADENGRFRFEKPAKEFPDIGVNRWFAVHTAILLGYGHESYPAGEEAVVESAWRKTSGEVRVVMRKTSLRREVLLMEARQLLQPHVRCGNVEIPMPESLYEQTARRIQAEGISSLEYVEWLRTDYARSGWKLTEVQLREFPDIKNFLRYVDKKGDIK